MNPTPPATRTTRLLFALVMAALASAALAQEQPIGFNNLMLGTSMADFQRDYPEYQCKDEVCRYTVAACPIGGITGALTACLQRNSWAGVAPKRAVARFKDAKLQRVTLIFAPAAFIGVVSTAMDRYGNPNLQGAREVTTKGGAKHQNQHFAWHRREGRLLVVKYGSSIGESYAVIQTQEDYAEQIALAQKEKAAKDDPPKGDESDAGDR